MEPTYDPLESSSKNATSTLLNTARECWSLACWLKLRQTWAEWEQQRAADAATPRTKASLPKEVEAFFGRYAHTTYCNWIPKVVRETVTRKERDRQRRKAAKEEAAEFDKLVKSDATEDSEPILAGTSLQAGEELFGALAEEIDKYEEEDGAESRGDQSWRSDRDGATSNSDQIHIEEPARPFGAKDSTPWQAWVATQELLWVPRKKGRVLMNELFKQPMRKPTDAPSQMLRCLTGYLKTIVREAVRVAAKEAILLKEGSNGGVIQIQAPISNSTGGQVTNFENMLPSKEDTPMSVMERELRTWGEAVARDEFFNEATPDGVRLSYYLETLKKSDGWDDGFVVSISDAAILACLKTKRATLSDRIAKTRERLKAAAQERASLMGCSPIPLAEWLEFRIKEVAVPWFWSEKIPSDLFGTIMDIIHLEHDSKFSCPFVTICDGGTAHALPTSKCHECRRK